MSVSRRNFLLGTLAGTIGSAAAQAHAEAPAKPVPSAPPAAAKAPAAPALPTSADLEIRDIQVEGDRTLGRRFVICLPKHLKAGEKVPLVVLLHGLGETSDERTGAFAWVERYGLITAYERLRKPPVARLSKRKDWTDARLVEVNAGLVQKPFAGLCLVCPYTPNVHKLPNPTASLDGYAKWIVDVVVPRARKLGPVFADAGRTAIDGCSLGGYVGLEVFLRKPDAFGAFGGVQSAFGEFRAQGFAERLATALAKGAKPLHFLTSEGDPFLPGNKKVVAELRKKNLACDLRVLPGPHDQPWLREAGTIEMLLWHSLRKKTA